VSDLVPRRGRMGRPSLLTPQVLELLVASLRASANVKLACEHARIGEATFHMWARRGRDELAEWAAERGLQPDEVNQDDIDDLPDRPYIEFLFATTKARNDFQLANLAIVTAAAQGQNPVRTVKEKVRVVDGVEVERTTETIERQERQWSAAAWLLERRFPDEYARTVRSEVSGPDGGAIVVDSSPTDVLLRRLAEMADREQAVQLPGVSPSSGLEGDPGGNGANG